MIKRSILFLNISLFLSPNSFGVCHLPENIDPAQIEYPEEACTILKALLKKRPVQPILLFGKTGGGKSKLSTKIATAANYENLVIECPELSGKYQGTAKTALLEKIEEAKKIYKRTGKKVVLIFEEIDAIAKKISSNDSSDNSQLEEAVQMLWLLMDKYQQDGNEYKDAFVFLFTTNHPEKLEPAFKNRIHNLIEINYPNQDQIKKFLHYLVKENHLEEIIKPKDIDAISKASISLNLRSIAGIITKCSSKRDDGEAFDLKYILNEVEKIKSSNKSENQSSWIPRWANMDNLYKATYVVTSSINTSLKVLKYINDNDKKNDD